MKATLEAGDWVKIDDAYLRLSCVTSVRLMGATILVAFVGGDMRTYDAEHWPALAAALGIDITEGEGE